MEEKIQRYVVRYADLKLDGDVPVYTIVDNLSGVRPYIGRRGFKLYELGDEVRIDIAVSKLEVSK